MSGQIPIKFNAELSRPANPVFPVYKGESFFIRAVLTDHGQPFSATLSAPKLYYQTADMENTWWSLDATQEGNVISVDFPASAIPTRDRLNCFLGSAGENFHAAFTMDFRHSPGATPNEVELPLPVLDFEKIEVLNAPYYTKEEANNAFQPKGGYKTRQKAVVDPSAGDTPANAFISGIAQNENGEIAPVKSPLPPFQAPLAFDNTPTEGSSNPVTSNGIKKAIDEATPSDYDAVKQQVQQNTTDIGTNTSAIAGINAKIPAQASAQNQLADKAFVNSSIATNTATFRGTYNLVADLSLTTSATQEQVAAAIAAKLAALSITPENNDYCFVQVPTADATPELISRVDRYKCTVTESSGTTTRIWGYEWSLNNSSFTADQWAAINSGITGALVAKLGALPTAQELAAALLAKYEKPSDGIPKTDLSEGVQASLDKADTALQNSGNQLLDGSINASNFLAAGQLIVGTSSNGLIFSQDDSFVYATVKVGGSTISTYKFPKDSDWAGDNGNIARLLDIYAAVQQIAPAWVSGTAYTVNALVSYNGVVYRCKTDTVAPHTAKPNTDTTHWEAKKVSELFLPLTDVVLPTANASAGKAADAFATHMLLEFTYNALYAAIGIFEFTKPTAVKVGSHVIYGTSNTNKAVYRCTTENAAGEDWDENDFTKLFDLVPLAPLASPAFTGTPTAPTPTSGDNSTKVATTAFVQAAVAGATPNLDYVMRVNPETGEIYYTTPDANA